MPRPLLLDKSYLDGAPTRSVHQLCCEEVVLCSETLFYELMTTNPASQVRCFSKFPEEPGSFALLPNVGALLQFEMVNGVPCGPLSNHFIPGTYVFNAALRTGTYEPPQGVTETLNTWKIQVQNDVTSFLERCQSVHQFFPELVGIEYCDFPEAVAAAKARISTDANVVRDIYSSFERATLPSKAPAPEALDPNWAWFRWVQCQLFAALRLFERYQCNIPAKPTPKVIVRAEHSMHDLEYVLLGSLAGAIASNDDEVIEDFLLASPNGTLFTSRPVTALKKHRPID